MSEQDRELKLLNELQIWMREPDFTEKFGNREIADWLNRRPTHLVPKILSTLTPKSSEGALLEAAEELVASLSLNDEDGLTEFAEPMVKMRAEIARAKAGRAQS